MSNQAGPDTGTDERRLAEHPIILFLNAIIRYWWALMSCAAFTFLGIYVAAFNKGRDWVLWGSFLLGITFLLVAAYKAWLTEYDKRTAEKRHLSADVQILKEGLARRQQGWAEEKRQLDANIQNLKEEVARKHPYDESTARTVNPRSVA
jgi:hypothetical protein